jgi:hypothetical protein
VQFNCWKCGQTIPVPPGEKVGCRDACPRCDASLHACRNCRFYDPAKNNQCAEPQAEWTRDKEAGNYCEYFSANPTLMARQGHPPAKADDAKRKFDSLFKA